MPVVILCLYAANKSFLAGIILSLTHGTDLTSKKLETKHICSIVGIKRQRLERFQLIIKRRIGSRFFWILSKWTYPHVLVSGIFDLKTVSLGLDKDFAKN